MNKDVRVFDNGGISIDRYTIVILDEPIGDMYMALGVDRFGGSYFSQYCECDLDAHLGKEISLDDLPTKTKEHVIGRLNE